MTDKGKGKVHTFLDTDYTKVNGQNYALISIVSPTSNQKHDKCAIKIKGCFDTMDNAKVWAKKLQQEDDSFDIFVVDMYSWLLIPPELEKINDVNYRDEMLHSIIAGREEEQRKAQSMFQQHQREMKEAGKEEISVSMFEEATPGTSSQRSEATVAPVESEATVAPKEKVRWADITEEETEEETE